MSVQSDNPIDNPAASRTFVLVSVKIFQKEQNGEHEEGSCYKLDVIRCG